MSTYRTVSSLHTSLYHCLSYSSPYLTNIPEQLKPTDTNRNKRIAFLERNHIAIAYLDHKQRYFKIYMRRNPNLMSKLFVEIEQVSSGQVGRNQKISIGLIQQKVHACYLWL